MLALETRALTKDYSVGFWRRRPKRALDSLTLAVERNEIFALLGPNGAGKSTTLKSILRLIFPTSGTVRILGCDHADVWVRARIGYLPENPYLYDHLTAEEFLNYAADLCGLSPDKRRQRVGDLLELVGLGDARGVPVGKLSKGMVQRVGIAQALVNDPELVFLDEPMSGLDPLGRREVRDLILRLRDEGKTVFFSTHILADAETLSDRVAILNRGRLQGCGDLRQILSLGEEVTDIVVENAGPAVVNELGPSAASIVRTGDRTRFTVPAENNPNRAIDLLLRHGVRIVSVNPVKMSLEEYFVSRVNGTAASPLPESGRPAVEEHPGLPAAPTTAKLQAVETGRGAAGSYGGFRLAGSLHRVGTIALHTFKESVREKVLYSLVVFALLLIGAAILVGSISVGIQELILVNLSLTSISLIGLLMAIFIGIGLVSKEIDRRSINNILSKPVRRAEFIAGKYLGLLLTLGVNTAVMTLGLYLAVLYQKHSLEAGDLAALEAVYLIMLELALVVGVALLFSCMSTPALSALYTFAVFIIGSFSSDIRVFGLEARSEGVQALTTAVYYLLPNFKNFNVIAQAAHGEAIPGYLLVAASLYALLYGTILVSAAILIFEEREFR